MLDHEGFRTAEVPDDSAASPDGVQQPEQLRWSFKQRPLHFPLQNHNKQDRRTLQANDPKGMLFIMTAAWTSQTSWM